MTGQHQVAGPASRLREYSDVSTRGSRVALTTALTLSASCESCVITN